MVPNSYRKGKAVSEYKVKFKLMQTMESLRSQMAICAIEMQLVYGDDFEHAEQLMGASNMVQDWIEGIRGEL